MPNLKEADLLLEAIQEAGAAINQLQKHPFSISYKANHDPLTAADLLANNILKDRLCGTFKKYGWLSEETRDDQHRLTCQRVWIVDPIDGTKEFVQGIPEYAISVALTENGVPILSAIFNPSTQQLFHAIKNQGVWLNAVPVQCKNLCGDQLTILASRNEVAEGSWQPFMQNAQVRIVGSIAYKLALIAAGFADATFSLGPKNEWDIAAGVLMVQEAGGIATDQNRNLFLFNQAKTRVSSIVACTKTSHSILHELITQATTKGN